MGQFWNSPSNPKFFGTSTCIAVGHLATFIDTRGLDILVIPRMWHRGILEYVVFPPGAVHYNALSYFGICSAPLWSTTDFNILRYFGICSAPTDPLEPRGKSNNSAT